MSYSFDYFRELDGPGSCRRRQSEPPISFGCLNSEIRDDSYIRAIFKFKEWRSRHRYASFRSLSRKPKKNQVNKTIAKGEEICVVQSENVKGSSRNLGNSHVQSNGGYEEIYVDPNEGCNDSRLHERQNCRSLSISENQNRNSRRWQSETVAADNEVREFENVHCSESEQRFMDSIPTEYNSSPPKRFFRESSNPFTCTQPVCNSRQYIPDVLLDSEPLEQDKNPYQEIKNIKGEEVDYSVPFCEKSCYSNLETESEKFCGYEREWSHNGGSKQFIPVASRSIESSEANKDQTSFHIYNLTSRNNIMITDLDKSEGATHTSLGTSKNEILRELNSLERWSRNITSEQQHNRSSNSSLNEVFGSQSIITSFSTESKEEDISHKYDGMACVFLSSGIFRKIGVSKLYIRHPAKFVVDKALETNLIIMRKIRHPFISLLMATAVDVNRKLSYLILEPFKCTLNQLLYEFNVQIPIEDSINYTIQISKAAVYMQENGMIHSNISSHAVFVCIYNKQVKLSLFQLTVLINNHIKEEIFAVCNDKLFASKMSDLSGKYLPYFIEYRKIFSQHYYQPPELITTQKKFVFPFKQTDVYGIALTLWEMLNGKIPFAMFNYSEMEKIFSLKNAQLPNFEAERCKRFKNILDRGLRINPKERIEDVDQLHRLLQKLKETFRTNNQGQRENFMSQIINDAPIFEFQPSSQLTTSTVKKGSKSCQGHPMFSGQHVEGILRSELSEVLEKAEHERQPELEEEQYNISTDNYSLPNTPIARNNKILKTVWLTNKRMTPLSSTNYNCESLSHSSSLKRYNVNITIIQNEVSGETSPSNMLCPSSIQSQIKYWDSLTSSEKTNKDDLPAATVTQLKKQKQRKPKKHADVEKDRNTASAESKLNRKGKREQAHEGKTYYPSMPELLSETFRRKDKKADDEDFEKVLWKREKKRCEQSSPRSQKMEESGVLTPERASVKETVNKFERITSDADNSKNASPCVEILKTETDDCHAKESTQLPNRYKTTEAPTNNTQNSKVSGITTFESTNDTQGYRNELKLDIQKKAVESKISKFDIMFRYDLESKIKKVYSNFKLRGLNDANPLEDMINMNTFGKARLANLGRSVSDVGCSPRKPQGSRQQYTTLRHSIVGTEIHKNIAHFGSAAELRSLSCKVSGDCVLLQADAPTNGDSNPCTRITCKDCGSHNIFINDKIKKQCILLNTQLPYLSREELKINADSNRNSPKKVSSTHDLYIDDDFKQELAKLGPNLKLNAPDPTESLELPIFKEFDSNLINFIAISTESLESSHN